MKAKLRRLIDSLDELNPPQLLLLTYTAFLVIGTLVLKLPMSTHQSITWLDALFTATSAITCTGLIVLDPGIYTVFGEVVILLLIQIGGLGIMSYAILVFMLIGRKIGIKERVMLQQSLNKPTMGGVIRLIKHIFFISITIEFIAWILLSLRWVPSMGWSDGLYASFFHAISGFNNAGFSLWSSSMESFVGDPTVNLIITFLIITGSLGFTVLNDLLYQRRFRKFSLHTKLMLMGTLLLNLLGILVIYSLEFHNPQSIGAMSNTEQFWASYFQAISVRTTGFNSIDISQLKDETLFFMSALMFIGGGSASVAGGIKVTTFIVALLAIIHFIRRQEEVVIFNRTIREPIIMRCFTIIVMSIAFVILVIFFLVLLEDFPLITIFFEAMSAFGAVGMSTGVSAELGDLGKLIISITMFVGKIGTLTLAFSFARASKKRNIHHPKEDILTG